MVTESELRAMREVLDRELPGFVDAVKRAADNPDRHYVAFHPQEFSTDSVDLQTIGVLVKYASAFKVVVVGVQDSGDILKVQGRSRSLTP